MHDVGLELFDDFFYFALRCDRYAEILVERKGDGYGAFDQVVAVHLFFAAPGTTLTRCDHEHFVPTTRQAFGEISAEGGNTVDSRPVKVGCDEDFHIIPVYHPFTRLDAYSLCYLVGTLLTASALY